MNIKNVTLALGSNLGDSARILANARASIEATIGPVIARSRMLETKAWGRTDQPDYLNQVIVVQPSLLFEQQPYMTLAASLHCLLDATQAIENAQGRVRAERWGPRTCDIDIVFVDDVVFTSDRLTIPHLWWRERDFVGGLIDQDLPWLLTNREQNETGPDHRDNNT